MKQTSVGRLLFVAVVLLTVGATGCLDEVPVDEDGAQLTEEELAGDGQPEDSEELIIESGTGVSGALTLYDDTG